MQNNIYTLEMWQQFKKSLGLNNKDIAEATGLSEGTVKNVYSGKKLATWAMAMIYVWAKYDDPLVMGTEKYVLPKSEAKTLDCGCSLNEDSLFIRGNNCGKLRIDHNI